MTPATLEDTLRVHGPRVLGALTRRYGTFPDCEDAVQLALLAATEQWPAGGIPDDPTAWLATVARRRLLDIMRARRSREARERRHAAGAPSVPDVAAGDDSLSLLLLCAHPALPPASQVALTLRAVAGLSTAQIATLYYLPEATIAQRISRAKTTLRHVGATFEAGGLDDPGRLGVVHHVLYLMFSEGHTASRGDRLLDVSIAEEAIRLTRQLADRTRFAETHGLLALMLLTHARRDARVDAGGDLIPLEHQDRSRWVDAEIAEGLGLIEHALRCGPVGPFQLQAAIAAVHAETVEWAHTDWRQIVLLYRMLDRLAPSSTVTLNLAVALAMAQSPAAGLALVDEVLHDPQMQRNHRAWAARAHLLEQDGDPAEAAVAFRRAAAMTHSIPEQRFLQRRARRAEAQAVDQVDRPQAG